MIFETLPDLIQQVLLLGAKFGYINKKLFFQHVGHQSLVFKYRMWNQLLDLKFISPWHGTEFSKNYYYLNKKGKDLMERMGVVCVSKVHPIYFEHDNAVMKFAIVNSKSGYILNDYQTENSMRLYDNLKQNQLFGGALNKIPDLIMDLNVPHKKLLMALEIEKSAKSQLRYDDFVLGYSKSKWIDMVLVAYSHKLTRESILISMKRLGYPRNERPIAFCSFSDLVSNPTNFVLEIEGHRIRFSDYVKNIQQILEKQVKKLVKTDLTFDLTKNE